ncbi:hypothetical protein NM09_11195 [Vibrio caribbeanicus]|uniref:Uncharacterized protein n=1 Tax=Vibrio caribbeanicus TaxID=701175 RepID=A0ACC4NWN5_9VIBR|nr:SIR2 family protein [Vibrio caribbeanicus]KHD24724.1 hypothetical protein NM09_11195 [Vibrio caribbeanicus]
MDLNKLKLDLARSSNGTSLLFTGAGFSYGAINILKKQPQDARSLSFHFSKLAGIEPDEDLEYSSEMAIIAKGASVIIDTLKKEYTIKSVSESHKLIAAKNWKRVYTTNYDRVFEIATNELGKHCDSVSILQHPASITSDAQCIHLNEIIDNLDIDTLGSDFKLTESSYISPERVERSKWKNSLRLDFEQSTAIFFVGYSLADLDIKFLLGELLESIKDKVYFIVKPNEDKKSKFLLGKFGHVLDIGVDEFANLVGECMSDEISYQLEDLRFFEKHISSDEDYQPTDIDKINLLVKGELIESQIPKAIYGHSDNNYLVYRNILDTVKYNVDCGNNILLSGSIASGKSILLKMISSMLFNEGMDVFHINNESSTYRNDLNIINNKSSNPIFIIDNVTRHENLVSEIYSLFRSKATIIMAGKMEFIEKVLIFLRSIDLRFYEHNIDRLHYDEISMLNDISNSLGFWGEDDIWSRKKKISYLTDTCKSRLNLILLHIFNSEVVKDRLDEAFNGFRHGTSKEKEVFICLIIFSVLSHHPTVSLVSEILNTNIINRDEFKNSNLYKLLLSRKGLNISIQSSVLASFMMKEYCSPDDIIDVMILMILFFNFNKKNGDLYDSLFKELVRYKNVSYILAEDDDMKYVLRFYNRLKDSVSWIKKTPHFWLQYGMSYLSEKDFSMSKSCFDSAYAKAKSNDRDYNLSYIDNQMIRWNLEYSFTLEDFEKSMLHFYKAYRLQRNSDVDYYYCRQIHLMVEFFDNFEEQLFHPENRDTLGKFSKRMKKINSRLKKSIATINFEDHNSLFEKSVKYDFNQTVERLIFRESQLEDVKDSIASNASSIF